MNLNKPILKKTPKKAYRIEDLQAPGKKTELRSRSRTIPK